MKLYLASTSPRRRVILKEAGFRFETLKPPYRETWPKGVSPVRLAVWHAKGKALSAAGNVKSGVVIGSDTIVVDGERSIGKPKTLTGAFRMLKALSGRTHTVVTGVALVTVAGGRVRIAAAYAEASRVRLKDWPDGRLRAYLRRIRPLDKAGAYAAQSRPTIVESIRGSATNVAGLPIESLRAHLARLKAPSRKGTILPRRRSHGRRR